MVTETSPDDLVTRQTRSSPATAGPALKTTSIANSNVAHNALILPDMDACPRSERTNTFSIRADTSEDASKIDYCSRVFRVNASLAMTIKC